VGTGRTGNSFYNDFWEFNPAANAWVQKANFPGAARAYAAGFSIGTNGYIGTGADNIGNIFDDFYEWNQSANTWSQKANYPNQVSDIDHAAFSIGCQGYFGTGADDPSSPGQFFNDFWEYTPDNLPAVPAVVTASSTICIGDGVLLTAGGGTGYVWSTGSTDNVISVVPSSTTTYSVTVSTDCGSKTVSSTVTVVQSGTAGFTFAFTPCESSCMQFTNASVNAFSWCWTMGDGGTSYIPNPCWEYGVNGTYNPSLIINCNTGCADTASLPVQYEMHDTASVLYIPNAFSPNDDNENDKLGFFMRDKYCMTEFSIVIYNRWGEKVFETADITAEWDGTFNGTKPDSDVFTYYCKMVSISGAVTNRRGNISLVR
jgi:gliding motility-associated-like protein